MLTNTVNIADSISTMHVCLCARYFLVTNGRTDTEHIPR